MKKYTIWKLSGPHDTFEVEAENFPAACFSALAELGWGIDAGKGEMGERAEIARATLRFIPMLLKENPKRWAIRDRKKKCWVESKTGHLFIYANEEAAERKAEKLEEVSKND